MTERTRPAGLSASGPEADTSVAPLLSVKRTEVRGVGEQPMAVGEHVQRPTLSACGQGGLPVDRWIDLLGDWLADQGFAERLARGALNARLLERGHPPLARCSGLI